MNIKIHVGVCPDMALPLLCYRWLYRVAGKVPGVVRHRTAVNIA